MRRVPIRIKLVAALAVPLLGLLVVTVAELGQLSAAVDEVGDQTELARAAVGPAGLITRLQDERSWPAAELTGSQDIVDLPVEDYGESRRLTDEAIAAFREDLAGRSNAVAAAYEDALAGLDALTQLRADIDAGRNSPLHGESANDEFAGEIYARYTALIRPFFDATEDVAVGIDDTELRRGTELVNVTSRQVEVYVALARLLAVTGTVGGGVDTPEETAAMVDLRVRWDDNNAALQRAQPPYDAIVAEQYPTEIAADLTELVDAALRGDDIDIYDLLAPLGQPDAGGFATLRVALVDELDAQAAAARADAERDQRTFLVIALTTLAAAGALTWLVSRSITGPLRSLTRQATEMAEERLPAGVDAVLRTPLGEDVRMPAIEPVRVSTRDEVREVADALNTVQETALGLAVEQAILRRNLADSFVNLGRRNQNLLRRQIDYITAFEHRETDPEALANLFRLDHLATRMRRNAESLLVLAGVEPSRQWMSPVQLTDVVRAAVGEVEDYQRVALRDVQPATLAGAAAADLAHLMAELVENALTFSPGGEAVDVHGHHHPGGYTLAIVDRGVGMSPAALEAANRRLAGLESFTVAPSRYLGHYVSGRLAARHGIRVQLASSPRGRGVAATIDLPPHLLGDTAGAAQLPPAPGREVAWTSATMSRPDTGV